MLRGGERVREFGVEVLAATSSKAHGMAKDSKGRLKGGTPYTVTITCDLTPPHNFIRETRHRSYATALKAIRNAKRELVGTPGLKIVIRKATVDRKTSWERILMV